jgi:hypothetical protein
MRPIFLFQQTATKQKSRDFDVGVVWQTLTNLGEALLARVPYIALGLLAFSSAG